MRVSVSANISLIRYRRNGEGEQSRMETLPCELSHRILSLLNCRQLASAAGVCRVWRNLASEAELWRNLYAQRWGQEKAASVVVSLPLVSTWKSVYEVQDRCDRIGMELVIVREGNCMYMAQNGMLLRFLGCRSSGSNASSAENSLASDSNPWIARQSNSSVVGYSEEVDMTQKEKKTTRAGLFDRILELIADLQHYQHRAKCARIS